MFIKCLQSKTGTNRGFILPAVLSLIIAAGILGTALLTVILNNFFVVSNNVQSQQSFNIAEAGLNYYLWHMSHNPTDYRDGNAVSTPDPTLGYGPYVHTYLDANANVAGTYTLWIKPQGGGSTIASIRSIGKATGSTISRTVQAQIGAASFASYGLVADTEFWFGADESAIGPVFSNQGVHMDGANSDTVGSANCSYTPSNNYNNGITTHQGPASVGCPSPVGEQNGVWCDSRVTTPVNCNTRDQSSWQYKSSTAVDFNQVSSSLCGMKLTALADYLATKSYTSCSQVPTTRTNAYVPQTSRGFSTTTGYLIQLNNNGTYDLSKVTGENDTKSSYSSALSTVSIPGATGLAIPPSGVIFVEDNVWVRTATNSSFHGRVTIASGRLASSNSTNITVADDILYSTKDGQDAIGLVAENDVDIAPYAPPSSGAFNFEVDAAALAENGSVTWPATYDGSNSCTKGWVSSDQTFTFYGSVATRQPWTWNYQDGGPCGSAVKDNSNNEWISGIEHTSTTYDYNLQYAPPPSYPVTGSYNILSWREVLTHP